MMNQSTKSKLLVILTMIVLAIVISGFLFIQSHRKKIILPAAVSINTTGQPFVGDANAPVRIVMFEDLKCINCKHFNDRFFPQIKKKYIDTKIANYTLILLAFIPGSIPAANAAFCLQEQNPNYFFPFVEYVFAHQPPENEDWATSQKLLEFAKNAIPTADLAALDQCVFISKHTNILDKNLQIAATVMKGTVATPSMFINGMPVDSLTLERISALIEAAQKQKS